jgi:biotin transport system permease protein/energy-coupling factor transport system permease protein
VTSFIANLFASRFDLQTVFSITFQNHETAKMLVKLFCVMQSASILFKTSTSLQIRDGIGVIESAVRKILPVSKKNTFTDTIALFVCFIPMVYKNWELSKRAWFARGGKSGIKMMKSIFPVFFSVGIKQAYNAARAMAVRNA